MKTQSLQHSYLKRIDQAYTKVAAADRNSSERKQLDTINHLQHKFNPGITYGNSHLPKETRTALKIANRDAIKKAVSECKAGKHCPTLAH